MCCGLLHLLRRQIGATACHACHPRFASLRFRSLGIAWHRLASLHIASHRFSQACGEQRLDVEPGQAWRGMKPWSAESTKSSEDEKERFISVGSSHGEQERFYLSSSCS